MFSIDNFIVSVVISFEEYINIFILQYDILNTLQT